MKQMLAAVLVLAGATAAAAQEAPSPCAAVASTDSITVELERPLFFEDDEDGVNAELRRALGIQKLAPEAVAMAITDPAVCEAWLPDILTALQSIFGPGRTTEGYSFELLQFGPYLMVLAGFADPSIEASSMPSFIFEMQTRTYLGMQLGV